MGVGVCERATAVRGWDAVSDMKELDYQQGAGNARQYGRNRPGNARARVRRGPPSFWRLHAAQTYGASSGSSNLEEHYYHCQCHAGPSYELEDVHP